MRRSSSSCCAVGPAASAPASRRRAMRSRSAFARALLFALLAGLGTVPFLAAAVGVWMFFLVQCLHPLLGGERRPAAEAIDPFEKARRELERLLGEGMS